MTPTNSPADGLNSPQMSFYTIEIIDRLTSPIVDHGFLESAIRRVLLEQQVDVATISVALVDDAEILALNRQFLGHNYATDVISFLLDQPEMVSGTAGICPDDNPGNSFSEGSSADSIACLNGELIVSNETALREASAHGWSPQAELLLYVVHGLLHLCGYDDLTDEARPVMRSRERELLAIWGFCPTGLEP